MSLLDLIKNAALASPIAIALAVGPEEIEAAFFPVAETVGIRVYHRDNNMVCWMQDMIKYRDLRYSFFSWRIKDKGSNDVVVVTPYDPVTQRTPFRSETFGAAKKIQSLNQCFDLPSPIRGTGKVLIFEARGSYSTWHGLYEVHRNIGPIEVDGVSARFI